jgi:hypothetical protein
MRKIILLIVFSIFLINSSWAALGDSSTSSAFQFVSITDNVTTHPRCRGVWVGTTQSIDLYDGYTWTLFQGATAGTVIPAQALGCRIDAGSAAPNTGDCVFLY